MLEMVTCTVMVMVMIMITTMVTTMVMVMVMATVGTIRVFTPVVLVMAITMEHKGKNKLVGNNRQI